MPTTATMAVYSNNRSQPMNQPTPRRGRHSRTCTQNRPWVLHNEVAHGGIRRQALLSRAAAAKASIDGNSIA